MSKINLAERFARFDEIATPKIVAELNGQHVKLVKFQGTFVWHHHEHEDELFYVIEGTLTIDFRDRSETLGPGELIVVPRGVEHRPRAEQLVKLMLFEPAGTLNTGNVTDRLTVPNPERLT